jgi:hypothetical protein
MHLTHSGGTLAWQHIVGREPDECGSAVCGGHSNSPLRWTKFLRSKLIKTERFETGRFETGRFSPNLRSSQSKPFGVSGASVHAVENMRRESAMSVLHQTGELNRLPTSKRAESLAPWAALASACAAWMFDAMDLQIFTLVLFPSVSDLVGTANPASLRIQAASSPGGSSWRWVSAESHSASPQTGSAGRKR